MAEFGSGAVSHPDPEVRAAGQELVILLYRFVYSPLNSFVCLSLFSSRQFCLFFFIILYRCVRFLLFSSVGLFVCCYSHRRFVCLFIISLPLPAGDNELIPLNDID